MTTIPNGQIKKQALLSAVVLSIFTAAVVALGQASYATSPEKPIGSVAKADFFVSPRGNDNWSGRLANPRENDGPFATVAHAREVVREAATESNKFGWSFV